MVVQGIGRRCSGMLDYQNGNGLKLGIVLILCQYIFDCA